MFGALLLFACHPHAGDGTADSARATDDSTPFDDSRTDDSRIVDDSGTDDRDGDGWIEPDDCDDDDGTVYPGAPEACVDHKDNDCDDIVDHCDLDRESHVEHRFIDPDHDTLEANDHGGFGWWMGFLDTEPPGLWISPQMQADDPTWRQAWATGWSAAEVSGFETLDDDHNWWSMVETEGDFDSDGFQDLVLSQWGDDVGITSYLFYEPVVAAQSLDTASARVVVDAPSDYSASGWFVRAVGDQTGDGSDDLLVGVWPDAWMLAGPISANVHLSRDEPGASTAMTGVYSAAGLDFDGDGTTDLATSDPFAVPTGMADLGAAYVYLGPTTGTLEPAMADREWHGARDGPAVEQAGTNVDFGDCDGDGRDDLIVRTLGNVDKEDGAVYLVDQDAADEGALRDVARAQIDGSPSDHLGVTRGEVADFDHDGRSDIVVSSLQQYPDAKGQGYVAVLLGPLDGQLTAPTDANLTLRGSDDDWGSGISTVAGDLDGDGELELAIGSIMYDEDGFTINVVDIVTPALLFAP